MRRARGTSLGQGPARRGGPGGRGEQSVLSPRASYRSGGPPEHSRADRGAGLCLQTLDSRREEGLQGALACQDERGQPVTRRVRSLPGR